MSWSGRKPGYVALILLNSRYLLDIATMSQLFRFHKPRLRMDNTLAPFTAQPCLCFVTGFLSWGRSWETRSILVLPARHSKYRCEREVSDHTDFPQGRQTSYILERAYFLPEYTVAKPYTSPPPAVRMCRQFYRQCRDCHLMFRMPEPDMKETCEAFRKARATEPDLETCPVEEIKAPRPKSGHGSRVCTTCKKRNKEEQRKRENAQKRARRAKIKKDKKTAGIGSGNVVWTPPPTPWTPSVVDAHTLALHSPPARRKNRRLNTFSRRSVAQQLQYGPRGNNTTTTTNTAPVVQNHLNAAQLKRDVYAQSRQVFETTMVHRLQSLENGHDRAMRDVQHLYRREPQYLPTIEPYALVRKEDQAIGLGITMANEASWEQTHTHTETCSVREWKFRMELNEWSTVFDDDDEEVEDVKESIENGWEYV